MHQDTPVPVSVTSREELLAATNHHPFARLTSSGKDLRGFRAAGAVAWCTTWAGTTAVASALGDPVAAARLLATLAGHGALDAVRRVNLPGIDHAVLGPLLPATGMVDWDFRWTTTPPPTQPDQQRVRALEPVHDAAVDALLDVAFPGTHTRPGDARVRRWYGIWQDDRLVACGADRSRSGTGSMAAVAVDPAARGRGLGAALTAAMAERILADCDVVTLGVTVDNVRADRLYRRLGFTDASRRTSANLIG